MRPGFLAVLGVAALALGLAACSRPAPPPAAPPASVSLAFEDIFADHFTPPARVVGLKGLPLYNTAVETTRDGSPPADASAPRLVVYVLISPHSPVQGILVASHEAMSLSFLHEKEAKEAITVSGPMNVFRKKDLVAQLKQKEITLATDASGLPLWIDNEEKEPEGADSTNGTPAPATPSPQPSNHPTQRQNEENAPYDRELVLLPALASGE